MQHPGMPGGPAVEPVVLMRDVNVTLGSVEVLSGISLAVPPGTILGLIGPSGAGKTTTVRVLTGSVHPASGEVRVLGTEPKRFKRRHRESIGYMPQLFVLYPDLTTKENVDVMGALFGMLWRRRARRAREVLELVDLWDVRKRRASQLSGGMQRRLELACALVHDPALLFLDEPTAGLDPLLRRRVWTELRRLRDAGRTLVVTTQHVGEAEYCDAVALISDGRLLGLAPPDQLRRQALGGDLLDIETAEDFDPRVLPGIPGVLEFRVRGPRQMMALVADAGATLPLLIDAVERAGGDVKLGREHRPTFDEVFAILVGADRDRQENGAANVGTTANGATLG